MAYDIRCPKRWRRVFKLMKRKGEHHQLSVFLVLSEPRRLRRLADQLGELIDPETDTVMIAPVDERATNPLICLGKSDPLPGAQVVVI